MWVVARDSPYSGEESFAHKRNWFSFSKYSGHEQIGSLTPLSKRAQRREAKCVEKIQGGHMRYLWKFLALILLVALLLTACLLYTSDAADE